MVEVFMESRIQFRVDEETKQLAQKMAASQGRTLSDACRELTEQLAEEQRKVATQETWLANQINEAFARYDAGNVTFYSEDEATIEMEKRKAKIRAAAKS
jgi:antitoxin component of RelBE/YafQ-DinJ toxin-antitoxin module